ncbi:LCP family glycopolymer transferase [Amedibacillus sp. YH-ame10]
MKYTSDRMKNEKIRKKKQRSRYYSIGFSFLYLLLSILLIVQILIFDILPIKYLIPLIIILLLIASGLMYIQLKRRMARATMLLGRVIILILSVILCFVNFYIFKTNNGLNRIANNKNMITISVVVNKDSKASDLKDLAKSDFGRSQSGTQQYIVKALADVQYETGKDIVPKSEKSIQTLVQNLYDGKIDAIILEENMRSLFTDAVSDFTDNTKVVWTKSYEKEEEENEKSVAVTEEPFNVYISGIDTYGTVDTSGRSDVNMIVTVNPKTNQVLMTNIPRDYYIPQSCQANESDKLTHTGIFGVDCTVSSVENYFDVPINYYLKVNYSGVTNILTAIGDIEVDNPIEFTGGEGNYHFAVGKLKLNAQQALSYARERQSFLSSDAIRIQNQSRVLAGVINKVTSPSIIVRYAGLIDALSDSFQTNMGRNEINALVKMQISDMPSWTISTIAVTGEDAEKFSAANGFNSFVLDPNVKSVKEAKKIIDMVTKGEDITAAIKKYKETNFVDEEVIDTNFYKDRNDLGERSDVELAD